MKFLYLDDLAGIVVNIDEGKNVTDGDVVALTDEALRLVSSMKAAGQPIGALHEIFAGMQLMCSNRAVLTELIDMAHEEIVRLLGNDAWRVYGFDELGCFCSDAFSSGDMFDVGGPLAA